MILSRTKIRERLDLPATDARSLVVTPLPPSDEFDADSLDLRLGSYILLPSAWNVAIASPYVSEDGPGRGARVRVHVPIGEYLVIPSHQTVLGATLEFIKLPYDLSGEVLTKSSVARTFVVVETAPWVHPNYRGCLTLEIANVSNSPALLYPGVPMCQLVLSTIEAPEPPPERLGGRYLGPIVPEEPIMPPLERQLGAIGAEYVRIIGSPESRPIRKPTPEK